MKKTQTTILLLLEEQVDGHLDAYWTPPLRQRVTTAREAFAKSIGLDLYEQPLKDVGDDLAAFRDRLHRIGEREGFTVTEQHPLRYKLTQTTTLPRPDYAWPEGSFRGCDQTKWGPTDFYEEDQNTLIKAFESSLDFETPWLSCKKEILSSRITRSGRTITVEVSVSDDFDTPGMGCHSFTVNRNTTTEQFLAKLEDAGDKAWGAADEDRKGNACYVGYSVGPVGEGDQFSWVTTYLVDIMGFDTPSGDNYYRFGWQEVPEGEEDGDIDTLPDPELMPPDIARKLADAINGDDYCPAQVDIDGWRAKRWND
jgi:hypothetical protein